MIRHTGNPDEKWETDSLASDVSLPNVILTSDQEVFLL